MAAQPLGRRLQGFFWEFNPPVRRCLRRFRTHVSLALHRTRHLLGRSHEPRVISTAAGSSPAKVPHPAIGVIASDETEINLPNQQTESSVTIDRARVGDATFITHGLGMEALPAAHLEAMLMAAAAEDLNWVAAGWSAPAPGRYGPSGAAGAAPTGPLAAHLLLRRPSSARARRSPIPGRVLPHITAIENCADSTPLATQTPATGPYRLRTDAARSAVVTSPCFPVDEALSEIPVSDGRPTVLFLLPFLAVGGAERLLFDLMEGLSDRYRLLVATTDPHTEALGQTVDRTRELTPHVYTLGDWLPREAVPSAIRHLIRRWQVQSLVSWNGSVIFYDEVDSLHRAFPRLRIVHQLFNHHGGWIEHISPSLIEAVDTHIAVNSPIARALVTDRGAPDDAVVTIHHAVGTPEKRDEARRARLRREIGADDDTVVIGTFIRMHPQKRPLDVVALARRMATDNVHFLLVGGGSLDDAVDREIAADPPPNLTRWPMQTDASPLYDAIDLCLMTSEFEGLPVFLLDGLARAIPGVATAVGDIPLLFEDGGGRVVDRPGDLDALVTAIRGLLDADDRRSAGERGRRSVAERFGLDRYVAAYEAVIFPRLHDERSDL